MVKLLLSDFFPFGDIIVNAPDSAWVYFSLVLRIPYDEGNFITCKQGAFFDWFAIFGLNNSVPHGACIREYDCNKFWCGQMFGNGDTKKLLYLTSVLIFV